MIIDLILDRNAGREYQPKKFYNEVMNYYNIFPEIAGKIAETMDEGTEQEVKQSLINYIRKEGYNHNVEKYINSVNWL